MRSSRFQSSLLLLAFAAALLMAVAPVVSRWVQSHHAAHEGMAMPGHAMASTAEGEGHAMHAGMDHAMHMGHAAGTAAPSPKPQMPADPHAAHGEACDYCTMASRLLPMLALLLVLAPLLYRLAPASPRRIDLPASLRWPAHLARGPPLFS